MKISTHSRHCRYQLLYMAFLPMLFGCEPQIVPDDGNGNDNGMDDPTAGKIFTIAGTGTAGFSGDGGSAAAAEFNSPIEVLVRPSGEILVADFDNHRVRSINSDLTLVATFAGSGQTHGDDAIAQPTGISLGDDGSLFVAGWSGHLVFRYPTTGPREVVAGTGTPHCISSNPGTRAASSTLCFPCGVGLLGDGTLIFTEQGCNRIRHVTADGILETLAGTGGAGYTGDDGLAIDATFSPGSPMSAAFGIALSPEDPPDEVYVADTDNHVIREINLRTGAIETFAGTGSSGFDNGSRDQATFNRPTHVFVSSDHAVWVADTGNHAIRRIDPLGTSVETVVGTGTAGYNGDDILAAQAQLNMPGGIFVTEQGDLLIADTGNHRIRRIAAAAN